MKKGIKEEDEEISIGKIASSLWQSIQSVIRKHCNMRLQVIKLQQLAQNFQKALERLFGPAVITGLWPESWTRFWTKDVWQFDEEVFVASKDLIEKSFSAYGGILALAQGKAIDYNSLRLVQAMCSPLMTK